MIFCASGSPSAGAGSSAARLAGAGGSTAGFAGAAAGRGAGTVAVASIFGKSFEIGGRNVLYVFTWPSFDSFPAFALSISETGFVAGAAGLFGAGARAVFAAAAEGAAFFSGSAFFLGATFALAAGWCAAFLAGFRAEPLLGVFVGIEIFLHGSCL